MSINFFPCDIKFIIPTGIICFVINFSTELWAMIIFNWVQNYFAPVLWLERLFAADVTVLY
jgi:hypothetical protein